MPIFEYTCKQCNIKYDEFRSYEDRFLPGKCDMCGAGTERVFISPPGQMSVGLPDGTKRKGFTDLKEAAKLEAEAMDSRSDERKKLETEVRKLRLVKD